MGGDTLAVDASGAHAVYLPDPRSVPMSKEKNRGGKEVRKPKKEKPKTNASAPSTKWQPTKPS